MELTDRHLTGIKCTTLCPYFVRTPMILSKGMRPTSRWVPFMSVDRCARQAIDAILKEKVLAFVPTWITIMPIVQILSSLNMQRAARDYLNCRYEPLEAAVLAKRPLQTLEADMDYKTGLLDGASLSSDKINSTQDINTTFLTKHQENSCGVGTTAQNTLLPAMPNYFKSPSIVWFALIPSALFATFLVWHQPEIFQNPWLSYLGEFCYTLGTKYSWLVLVINIGAWIAHLGEGVYALYVCDELNFSHACALKWFLQTFIVGFPSLQLLLKYRKKRFSK
uniref:Transmembrane protein 254 n=1 Tax=Ditylenchus dipsaci TaxID=166011 RepID=A0A915D9W1_9BILA